MGGERPPADYDDWDFMSGRRFEREVFCRFGSSVHQPCSSPYGSFFLLVIFHRSSFRLSEDLVGMTLHSVIGGSPGVFKLAASNPAISNSLLLLRRLGS
jgi:hypothetical protein